MQPVHARFIKDQAAWPGSSVPATHLRIRTLFASLNQLNNSNMQRLAPSHPAYPLLVQVNSVIAQVTQLAGRSSRDASSMSALLNGVMPQLEYLQSIGAYTDGEIERVSLLHENYIIHLTVFSDQVPHQPALVLRVAFSLVSHVVFLGLVA